MGGHIEFGETRQVTLVREFNEELDCDVEIAGDPLVFEKIYAHQGMQREGPVCETKLRLAKPDQNFKENPFWSFRSSSVTIP